MGINEVEASVHRALDQLHTLFIPSVRLTFIARRPGDDQADLMIGDDHPQEVARLVHRRMEAEEGDAAAAAALEGDAKVAAIVPDQAPAPPVCQACAHHGEQRRAVAMIHKEHMCENCIQLYVTELRDMINAEPADPAPIKPPSIFKFSPGWYKKAAELEGGDNVAAGVPDQAPADGAPIQGLVVEFNRCKFEGPPPEPFDNWFDFARQKVWHGLRISALGNGYGTEAECVRLRAVIERDRNLVMDHVAAGQAAMQRRGWLKDGRGSYAYDDDRYQLEFGHAMEDFERVLELLAKIGKDLSDSPTTRAEAIEALKVPPKDLQPSAPKPHYLPPTLSAAEFDTLMKDIQEEPRPISINIPEVAVTDEMAALLALHELVTLKDLKEIKGVEELDDYHRRPLEAWATARSVLARFFKGAASLPPDAVILEGQMQTDPTFEILDQVERDLIPLKFNKEQLAELLKLDAILLRCGQLDAIDNATKSVWQNLPTKLLHTVVHAVLRNGGVFQVTMPPKAVAP